MRTPTTEVLVDSDHVRINLSRRDKIAALLGDQRIPITAITEVSVVTDPFNATSGLRRPGLAIPAIAKIGVWRRKGTRTLVVVRRGQQALRLDAIGQRFDAYLVGIDDPHGVARAIKEVRTQS